MTVAAEGEREAASEMSAEIVAGILLVSGLVFALTCFFVWNVVVIVPEHVKMADA